MISGKDSFLLPEDTCHIRIASDIDDIDIPCLLHSDRMIRNRPDQCKPLPVVCMPVDRMGRAALPEIFRSRAILFLNLLLNFFPKSHLFSPVVHRFAYVLIISFRFLLIFLTPF